MKKLYKDTKKRPDFYILDESFWNEYVDRIIGECQKRILMQRRFVGVTR